MDIKEQFNMVAEEYDANRRRFIPCFDEFYKNTTDFLASNIAAPECIIDLGAGTGLLSYYWYEHFKDVRFILTDIAVDMLEVAKRRFAGLDNFSYQVMDHSKTLPDVSFDAVISALSIHHLGHTEKQALFDRIYNALPDGGIFIDYDQFCAGEPMMDKWYDSYWESQLYSSGLTEHDIELWLQRRRLDRETTVQQQTDMLRQSGFGTVKCVYDNRKFAVIAAIK